MSRDAIRPRRKEENTYYCSFCGKSQHEVKKLIAGPTVFICDECVRLCADICGFGIVEKLTPASDRVDMSCFGSARTDEDES